MRLLLFFKVENYETYSFILIINNINFMIYEIFVGKMGAL